MARFARLILLVFMLSCSEAHALRVVSMYPGHSDNIFALGGGDSLVALSENDDDNLLPELPRLPLRSGAERILALSPDVIVTRSFAERINPNVYDVLRRSGVRVLVLDPPSWENFPEYLRTLAVSLGLDSEKAIARLDELVAGIRARVPEDASRPRVFLEATSREIHTCAPDSWAANLIALAGGINIAGDARPLRTGSSIASWGIENVLQSHGNLDVYIIQTGAMNQTSLDDFHARSWSKALGDVRVVTIPERFMSRPSLLGLQRGGSELIRIFWGD